MTDEQGRGDDVGLIEVDDASGIPIWVQVRNRLMYLIDSGHYKNGDRLPTVRALAADINVNYHTVNKVYTSLEHDGYISSKRGRGAFACKTEEADDEGTSGDVILIESIRQCIELGMTVDDVEKRFAKALDGFRTDQ